jgi:hypothetical protein
MRKIDLASCKVHINSTLKIDYENIYNNYTHFSGV